MPRGGGQPPSRRGRRPQPRPERTGGRTRARTPRSELRSRLLIAIPALVFAVVVVSAGGSVFAVAAAALGLVCVHELFRMYAGARPIRLAGMLAVVALTLAALLGDERQVMLVMVASLPLVFLIALLTPHGDRLTPSVAVTLLGVVWIGVPVAHAVLLRELPHGDGILVDVLVGTFAGDTGAYFGGRAFGTRRLAPRISPNKTVEGLVIGILTAVIATWCAGLYQDWLGHGQALLLGLAVALAAPVGDLFESQVKRDAGVKDSGALFRAHGGALDRLDAVLFAVVAGYYAWLALM